MTTLGQGRHIIHAVGDRVGGAGGAVAGEVTAQVMLADWTKQQIATLPAGGTTWTQSEINAELSRLREEFRDLKSRRVDIAALAGGMASLLLGGSVNTGAMAGGNAAGHNAFSGVGAITGCAVGAPAAGVGCEPGAAAGALVGLGIDVAIAILIGAGVYIVADEVLNESSDSNGTWPSNDGPKSDDAEPDNSQLPPGHNGGPPLNSPDPMDPRSGAVALSAVLMSNPKHHPNSTSPQPPNVAELFANSIADVNGVRWAIDSSGVIHRFSKPSNGEAYWNGSTAGSSTIRRQDIPISIRRALG